MAYPDLYGDDQAKQAFAYTMENPAMVAMLGVGYEVADFLELSVGAIFAHEMLLFTAIAVAIMNILLTIRSTRADEEDGRLELVNSLPVGRLAYLFATFIVMVFVNVSLLSVVGIGLYALGIEGFSLQASLLYSSILAGVGLFFSGVTLVFAQLASTSRTTLQWSFLVLVFAYLLRAVGDVDAEGLSLLSPLGWVVRSGVFIENDWWPTFLLLIVGLVLVLVAFFLHVRRDLGSGMISEKKGKEKASRFLQTPLGFLWRMQRTQLLIWFAMLFLFSASFGAILGDLEGYYLELDFIQAFIDEGADLTNEFIQMLFAMMSLLTVVPVVLIIFSLKGEETKLRAEYFYSRAVSRVHMLVVYLCTAFVASIVLQFTILIGIWATGNAVMEQALDFTMILKVAFSFIPMLFFFISFAVLLIGLLPKWSPLVWLYLVYCFLMFYLGGLIDMLDIWSELSIISHMLKLLGDNPSYPVLIVVSILSLLLTVIGIWGYRNRDIA